MRDLETRSACGAYSVGVRIQNKLFERFTVRGYQNGSVVLMSFHISAMGRWCTRRTALFAILAAVALGIVYGAAAAAVNSNRDSYLQAASSQLKDGRSEEVTKTLSTLLWFYPDDKRARLLRGISYNSRQMFSEAISDLSVIATDDPEYLEGGLSLGASLASDGQLDRAVDVFRQHLTRYPGAVESRSRLSDILVNLMKHEEAVQLWEQHLQQFRS